jgi:hypothetical protein
MPMSGCYIVLSTKEIVGLLKAIAIPPMARAPISAPIGLVFPGFQHRSGSEQR